MMKPVEPKFTRCGTNGVDCMCFNGERCACPCHNPPEIRGWIVKRNGRYEATQERCADDSRWCCARSHARVHLTLDSARHARDQDLIQAIITAEKALGTEAQNRRATRAAIRDVLRAQYKIFRLTLPTKSTKSTKRTTSPLLAAPTNEEIDRIFDYAFDITRTPTEAERETIRDTCRRFAQLRGFRQGLPKAPRIPQTPTSQDGRPPGEGATRE